MFIRVTNRLIHIRNISSIECSGKNITFWMNHATSTFVAGSGVHDTVRYRFNYNSKSEALEMFQQYADLLRYKVTHEGGIPPS